MYKFRFFSLSISYWEIITKQFKVNKAYRKYIYGEC